MVYQEIYINWNVRTLEYLAVKVDESPHILTYSCSVHFLLGTLDIWAIEIWVLSKRPNVDIQTKK